MNVVKNTTISYGFWRGIRILSVNGVEYRNYAYACKYLLYRVFLGQMSHSMECGAQNKEL